MALWIWRQGRQCADERAYAGRVLYRTRQHAPLRLHRRPASDSFHNRNGSERYALRKGRPIPSVTGSITASSHVRISTWIAHKAVWLPFLFRIGLLFAAQKLVGRFGGVLVQAKKTRAQVDRAGEFLACLLHRSKAVDLAPGNGSEKGDFRLAEKGRPLMGLLSRNLKSAHYPQAINPAWRRVAGILGRIALCNPNRLGRRDIALEQLLSQHAPEMCLLSLQQPPPNLVLTEDFRKDLASTECNGFLKILKCD